jgi:predicted permease
MRERLMRLLGFGRHTDRALDDDVAAHLEMLAADYEQRGMSPDEARYAARRAFGGVEQMKEDYRAVRRGAFFDDTWRDAAYAVRALRKAPLFTATVVLTLALGIGANTAVFTLVDALAWRTLPIHDPATLLLVSRIRLGVEESGFTYSQAQALRQEARGAELAAFSSSEFPVVLTAATTDVPEPPIEGQMVSGNYFALLGVSPQLGRLIDADDDRRPNAHPVVALSDGYWTRRFARDPAVVGRTLTLSGVPFTIIGVTPREFFGVEVGLAPDVFLPIMMQPTLMPVVGDLIDNPTVYRTWLQMVARLDRNAVADQVSARLEPIYRQHLVAPPPDASRPGNALLARMGYADRIVFTSAATGVSQLRQQFSRSLLILFAIVGVVLLIGCANTANLLLARAAARRPELALRLALGAGRRRLFRQLLVEGFVLALLAGTTGLLVAAILGRWLLRYASTGRTPIVLNLSFDWRILTFAAALSLLTAIVFAFVPAVRAARVDLLSAMKRSTGPAASAKSRLHPGRVLVVVQVALSLMLLMSAGLFVRSLVNLTTPDHGAAPDRVLVVRVEPRGSNQRGARASEMSQRLHRIYSDLQERVRGIPGVQSVSMGNVSPMKPESGASSRVVPGGTIRQDDPAVLRNQPVASSQVIYPGYFATLGISLVGRDFTAADLEAASPPVCIVNEAFVRIAYPGDNPLGKPCTSVLRSGERHDYAIVGVADDSRFATPRQPPQPVVYTPFMNANTGRGQMILYARVNGESRAFLERIRTEVSKADSSVPLYEVRTIAEEVDAIVMRERLLASVSSFFGALALLLTAIGLHGLLAFLVLQRRRELAIRMAIGATRAEVVRLIARETMLLVAAGTAAAVPAAWIVGRLSSVWLADVLYGLAAIDIPSMTIAVLLLSAVGLLAASIPARRAATLDPMAVLRSD